MYRYLIFLLGCCLAGCTLENEYAEKIEVKDDTEIVNMMGVTPDNKLGYEFILNCRKCIRGELDGLDKLIETYMESFRNPKFEPRMFYQRDPYNQLYEQCLTKAAAEGKASLIDPKMALTNFFACAYISREMYAQGNLVEGAKWLRRLISLQGRKQGFETAGNIFIKKNETFNMGIKMLGEAAHLGSMSARSSLMLLIYTNPALRKQRDGEQESVVQNAGADGRYSASTENVASSDSQQSSPSLEDTDHSAITQE